MDARYDRALVKEFEIWRSKSMTSVPRGVLTLPFWRHREWLTTDHMNALIDMLLITTRREPGRFVDGWTALEIICWDALTNENYEIARDRLSQYVLGGFLRDGPLHWGLASKVYGIGHLHGNHWLCYEVSFNDQLVTVFDSMFTSMSWNEVSGFPPFAKPVMARHPGQGASSTVDQ
ncbi:hypothetical protein C2S52_007231 [Perilla frutescens var. hirtella]|nr:hypothetical protein C2S52_007231 [Perilla frutescens var. hirtella]